MTELPLLTLLIAHPADRGLHLPVRQCERARWTALIATLIDLALGAYLWAAFDPSGPQWQFVENLPLGGGISWALGSTASRSC